MELQERFDTRAPTDNLILTGFLKQLVGEFEGGNGRWGFAFAAVELEKAQLKVLLEANFDRALDAKYAIYEGLVWATFVHPLAELSQEEFESAVRQVAALHNTYGTTFQSMDVVFGAAEESVRASNRTRNS